MKVMHLINNLNREGAQIVVSNLVMSNTDKRVQYIICTRQPGGALAESLRGQGIPVIQPERYFGFRNMQKSLRFLDQAARSNHVDVVHAHMADAAFLSWLTARKIGLPLVISHHGDDILLQCGKMCRTIYFILLVFAARFASVNIAVSPSVASRVSRLPFIRHDKVRTIPNGVSIPDDVSIERSFDRADSGTKPITLVNIGRLAPVKGQRILIRAVAKLIAQLPSLKLYIVGDGPMAGELRALACGLNSEKHIIFTGQVEDVTPYLANADVFVSSSHSEGMPVSVLEAMAWGVPVVASDIPGNRNVVTHNKTGFLYAANSVDDLVKTVVEVVEKPETRNSVSAKARQMVERRYSTEATSKCHIDLYMSLAKQ